MDGLWRILSIATRPVFRRRRQPLQSTHKPLVQKASDRGDPLDPPSQTGQRCTLCNNFVTEGVFEYGDQWEMGVKEGLWRRHHVDQVLASSEAGCSFCRCLIRAFELSNFDRMRMRDTYASGWRDNPGMSQRYYNDPQSRKHIDEMSTKAVSLHFSAEKGGALRVRDGLDITHFSPLPWAVIYNPAGTLSLTTLYACLFNESIELDQKFINSELILNYPWQTTEFEMWHCILGRPNPRDYYMTAWKNANSLTLSAITRALSIQRGSSKLTHKRRRSG